MGQKPPSEDEKLVAVISPWDKLSALIKKDFRMESLPAEKKVIVWRDDLQGEQELTDELRKVGINPLELRKKAVTNWRDAD